MITYGNFLFRQPFKSGSELWSDLERTGSVSGKGNSTESGTLFPKGSDSLKFFCDLQEH